MGLFDKKYCDICGEKIGLLGNRKLEDGNLCKDCAKKLSPFFNDRRNSTVEEIRQQLAYREKNREQLASFVPNKTFGEGKKVYADTVGRRFIVTHFSDWRGANPDLVGFDQVKNIDTEIRENREEIFYTDSEGNSKSYSPKRYECDYEFNVTVHVESPWFDTIELELSDGNRPDSPYTDLYREYERQLHELTACLTGHDFCSSDESGNTATEKETAPASTVSAAGRRPDDMWICPSCLQRNTGKFCRGCGAAKPSDERAAVKCPNCGQTFEQGQNPKFCPECGSAIL